MSAPKALSRQALLAVGSFVALSLVRAPAPQAQFMLLLGGPVELHIDGSTVVGGQSVVSDASTLLQWEGHRRPKKITVETSAPGQVYTLRAELVGVVGRGTPQAEVTLEDGMLPQDLVRDIKNRQSGLGFIRYTASVAPDQGAGEDIHTVTFTLTDQ